MFSNLLKAAVAVVITPVSLVADIVTLPSTAYENKDAFGRTAKTLKQASAAIDAALTPELPNNRQ